MGLVAFQDHDAVAVGEPIPFSVYGADRKLLLAKGVPIANERMREAILAHGVYQALPQADTGAREMPLAKSNGVTPAAESAVEIASPRARPKLSDSLAKLRQQYGDLEQRSRFGLRIARDEKSETYPSTVIGVVNDKRYLILTAPVAKDGKLIQVREGEIWLGRLFNATTVFRFLGTVLKVASAPLPYLHLGLPKNIERRMVRRQPRALAALQATLRSQTGEAALIVDLSISGARIAVDAATQFGKDAAVELYATISMVDNLFELHLPGKVSALFGAADPEHPDVHFYGIQFQGLTETATLVLHGYVHEQLADELDRLSRVLAIEEVYSETPESWLDG